MGKLPYKMSDFPEFIKRSQQLKSVEFHPDSTAEGDTWCLALDLGEFVHQFPQRRKPPIHRVFVSNEAAHWRSLFHALLEQLEQS